MYCLNRSRSPSCTQIPAGRLARGAEEGEWPALLIEDLHVLECRVGDVDQSFAVHGNLFGSDEPAGVGGGAAELRDQLSAPIELLELALEHVHDVDVSLR